MPTGWAEKKGGHKIEDEGVDLPDRDDLNFAGAGVTVTDSGDETLVTIPGGVAVLPNHVHTAAAGEGGQLDWDDIWTDAAHDHSAAGEGGQLDWDTVWADAVHDHSSPGEGGTLDVYSTGQVDDLLADVSPNPTGSFLLNGGHVVWESGLQFRVSAANYYINSTLYSSIEQTITLNAADPGNDRIDVIGLDTTGTVIKVTGTPAASPSRPDVDPATQLILTFVLVPAGSATPGDVSTVIIYQENLGTPTEWAATDSGASIDPASTNNPRSGTKDVEFTGASSGDWLMFTAAATLNLASYAQLVLYIRSKATWAAQKSLRLAFRDGGVVRGNWVTIDDGLYGFDSSVTGAYQQIAIPLSVFAVPAYYLVDELRIEVRGSGATIGFYMDDVMLQSGLDQGAIGITREEADARYCQQANNLSDLEDASAARVNLAVDIGAINFIIDGGGSAITAGIKGDVEITFPMTLTAWTLLADASGAIKIDVWKDTYANFPPDNADSITNGHEPEIAASGVKAQDTDISDWSDVTVDAGDILRINVDSAATVTRVTLSLKFSRD